MTQLKEDLCVRARQGKLPEGFNQWEDHWSFLEEGEDHGITIAHVAARHGTLPKDFDQWDLVSDRGVTVASYTAYYGTLPADFDQWKHVDMYGIAKYGKLPADFTQWDLKCDRNVDSTYVETVAHVVARYGTLPADFDQWDLKNEYSWSREMVLCAWDGVSSGKVPLPERYYTVAHVAAKHGKLPIDFNQWDLVDSQGVTVADIAGYKGDVPV